jgi:hypothetical protein
LFLRAFGDDQVQLAQPHFWLLGRLLEGWRQAPLDAVLLEEGTPYGPVVALGNPKDPIPPYGSARGYFNYETWQDGVSRLADEAAAIVICLDDTDGVWWEIDNLLATQHFSKTLFLFHPKHAHDAAGAVFLARLVERMPASAAMAHSGGAQVPLGFFVDFSGRINVARSPSFSGVAYLLMLRWFLRTRFDTHPLPLGPQPSIVARIRGVIQELKANRCLAVTLAHMLAVGLLIALPWVLLREWLPTQPGAVSEWSFVHYARSLLAGGLLALLASYGVWRWGGRSLSAAAQAWLVATAINSIPASRLIMSPVIDVALMFSGGFSAGQAMVFAALGLATNLVSGAYFPIGNLFAMSRHIASFQRTETWRMVIGSSVLANLLFYTSLQPTPAIVVILWLTVAAGLGLGLALRGKPFV